MNTGAKLAAYGLVLAAVLGGGAAVGAGVGPIDVGGPDGGPDVGGHDGGHDGEKPPSGLPAGGLLVSQNGYTLQVAERVLEAGRPVPLSFVIEGPDGRPVRDYQLLHDRELHLIVVSADLSQFSHVHPRRDGAGTWTVELPAFDPGPYRAFADFAPRGSTQLTLGVDLTVPGLIEVPAALAERRQAKVAGGYQATLDGALGAGRFSTLTVTVGKNGHVVTTEPYLGAAGHLVAIRDGDLAYLHVHPLDDEPSGPVRFAVEVPSAGTYGLFFDFAHGGAVRTAAFVATAGRGAGPGTQREDHSGEGEHQ